MEVSNLLSFFPKQELPEQWNNTKKIQVTVKQQVAPLQASEVAIIRRKCGQFDVSLQNSFLWLECVAGTRVYIVASFREPARITCTLLIPTRVQETFAIYFFVAPRNIKAAISFCPKTVFDNNYAELMLFKFLQLNVIISLSSLQIKQHEFREDFRKTAPFQFDSTQYYERLDKVNSYFLYYVQLIASHYSNVRSVINVAF